MKIISLLCLSFVLLHCTDAIKSEYHIEAVYSAESLIIDGNLNDPVWKSAQAVMLKENRSANDVLYPQLQTQVQVCYDDSTLYFSFTCNDPDIWTSFTERDEYLWQEEAIEIFIDVDDVPETYVEIEVSPANVLFDSYIVDPQNIDVPATARFDLQGIRTAVNVSGSLNKRNDTDEKWTVEIALPFRDLANEKLQVVSNKTDMRINFYRLDKNKESKAMSYAWSPTGARFHKPSVFGELVFK